ncbi:MAG: phosphoribosyltransferase family protein [Patescibacteria group bacterium]
MSLGSSISQLIFPVSCFGCGAWDQGVVCPRCHERWQATNRPAPGIELAGVDAVYLLGQYADPLLATLIRAAKYQFISAAARSLGGLLAEIIPDRPVTTVVPIPLHRRRHRWRGYNQAGAIAQELARRHHWPYQDRLVRRQRFTSSQTTLDRDRRFANVADAFTITAPPPDRILLVDDVVTTGATMTAVTQTLRARGAHWIGVAAIAHGSTTDS